MRTIRRAPGRFVRLISDFQAQTDDLALRTTVCPSGHVLFACRHRKSATTGRLSTAWVPNLPRVVCVSRTRLTRVRLGTSEVPTSRERSPSRAVTLERLISERHRLLKVQRPAPARIDAPGDQGCFGTGHCLRGDDRNRTGIDGFAGRCEPLRHVAVSM